MLYPLSYGGKSLSFPAVPRSSPPGRCNQLHPGSRSGRYTHHADTRAGRQVLPDAAPDRPDEELVIVRTSSMGATVPPPVTTTFIPGRSPTLADAARSR